MPKHTGMTNQGISNRLAHVEDRQSGFQQQLDILTRRLEAYQQAEDPEDLFLNCQRIEQNMIDSAKVLETYVTKVTKSLDLQVAGVHNDLMDRREAFTRRQSVLLEELSNAEADCRRTQRRLMDAHRYCNKTMEAFHALKGQLDELAEDCLQDVKKEEQSLSSQVKIDTLQEQVYRMRQRMSKSHDDSLQTQVTYLQGLTHDLTGEVVAHESMLRELNVPVAQYAGFRSRGRAYSEERTSILTTARRRATTACRRSRSLSIEQRIQSAQRIAGLTREASDGTGYASYHSAGALQQGVTLELRGLILRGVRRSKCWRACCAEV